MLELEVFYGEFTTARAVVYARLPREAGGAHLTLSGSVRGPRCLHAHTLPATFSLVDLGPGPTLLARAIVTEPTPWSPELPAIYDVTVQMHRGSELAATERREIGFKPLGRRGSQLIFGGKNWVLRGVHQASTTATLPRAWHDAGAALVASHLDEEALSEASQWGSLSVVTVPSGDDAVASLRALARYPAAAIAVLRGEVPADFSKSALCPNVLLAHEIDPLAPATAFPAWADIGLFQADNSHQLRSIMTATRRPLIAVRTLESPVDLPLARSACDALQRDLAPLGQFAGYIV
jgi:hypothetical protein